VESLDLITHLEGKLKAAVNLQPLAGSCWRLSIKLMYETHPAGNLSFTLNGYDAQEAWDLAKNIGSNPFLMREIDEHLWGESD